MRPGQTLSQLTSRILLKLESHFSDDRPDLILGHGDTTTCFATAISSFYHKIPFYHVEAGLRTHRLDSPFPEEFNRQTIAPIAQHHFAPTELEKNNLIGDGIRSGTITITGSTVHEAIAEINSKSKHSKLATGASDDTRSEVVVTLHRRESSESLESTLNAIKQVASTQKDLLFICPVHPNPSVQNAFKYYMEGIENVQLTQPMEYANFISLLLRSRFVITDSGGVQEEAAFLGKPVLLVRRETERQDGINSGLVRLVGLEPEKIRNSINEILSKSIDYSQSFQPLTKPNSPSASEIIAQEVLKVC